MTAATRQSPPASGINYAQFVSPEHLAWKAHRELMLNVAREEAGYRGCIGLALIINAVGADSWAEIPGGENERRVFIPDNTVSWASIVDIPVGYFGLDGRKRDVHWASVRPTTVKFGMPALARETETLQCDFRAFPFDKAKVRTHEGDVVTVGPGPDALNTAHYPQLFRVFNALEWAMTTTAFAFRRNWQPKRDKVAKALGYEYDPEKKLLAFGGGVYDGAARPYQWMPQAYIGFPHHLREHVFDRATRATGSPQMLPVYSPGLREAFLNAMGQYLGYRAPFDGRVDRIDRAFYKGIPVLAFTLKGDRGEHEVVRFFRETCQVRKPVRTRFKAGDVVAEERFDMALPEDWYERSPAMRWDKWLWSLMPHRLDPVMRLWFERCAVSLSPGLVHFPAQTASLAAFSSAVDGELFWEVSNCMEYYSDTCDALVFPTMQIRNWYDLSGWLPGDVAFDLNPYDHRFESYQEQRERVAKDRREKAEAAERVRKAGLHKLPKEKPEDPEDQPWKAKGLPDPRTLTPAQHEATMKARVRDMLKKPK